MIKILDTTLRDGSYVVDFQFSKNDTLNISQTLENYNIEYIEIGHGLGLSAYRLENYKSLLSDEEYMSSIKKKSNRIKYGVFFIPDIGDFSDIDIAVKYGMDFIRIGTNINESEKGYKYIKYAKSKGLIVAANFMKSYAVSSKEFSRRVKEVSKIGVDYVYLVDSAGGMLPEDVKEYILKAKQQCTCELGFHGHNNLTLAIANSLAAIEAGATIIDSSLQGLGRDGGNASTEVLMSILIKKGLIKSQNLNPLLDYSEVNILPLLRNTGIKSMPLVSGIGLFHSGFYQKIKVLSEEHSVDIREIIIELSNINIIEPSNENILFAIFNVKKKQCNVSSNSYIRLKKSFTKTKFNNIDKLYLLIKKITTTSKKENKKSVFNIVITDRDKVFISNYIQTTNRFIIGNCQLNSINILKSFIKDIDGVVDILLCDVEFKIKESLVMKEFLLNNILKSKLYFYNDSEIWAKAIVNIILMKSKKQLTKIYLNRDTFLGKKISYLLESFGFNISYFLDSYKTFDFVIGLKENEVNKNFVKSISKNTIIIDASIGSLTKGILEYCFENKIEVMRVDMRVVVETEILQKDNSFELFNNIQGKKDFEGFSIVAGGIYGKSGEIVVDSIQKPSCVIGISNGDGSVKYSLNREEIEKVKQFEREIIRGIKS